MCSPIAATFALSPLQIKRILALGNLLPRIREAYRAEEIDAGTVRHLTLATKVQQKAWLALHDDPEAHAPRGSQLKAWLFGGASISVTASLFDFASYQGQIVTNLFEEEGYFADAEQFWAAQWAEIEARKAAYLAEGWNGVVIVPPECHFATWEHEHTPKRKGGRVYIDVSGNGIVSFHLGYLTRKEASAKDGHGAGVDKPAAPSRPEITATMASYVDLHRHAAVRCALAAEPGVALRFMVAHAICGSPLWRVTVQDQRSRNEGITQSVETSLAETRFDERRRPILDLLGFDPDTRAIILGNEPVSGVSALLLRLIDMPDAAVLEALAVVMAESLASGTCLIETRGTHLNIDMADYWAADEAFYSLIRDREVLSAILTEVGGEAVATAHAGDKGKTIKAVIGDCLTGSNDRAHCQGWVPRWMAFPPSSYTTRGGVPTVAAATRGRWLAEDDTPLVPGGDAVAQEQCPADDAVVLDEQSVAA